MASKRPIKSKATAAIKAVSKPQVAAKPHAAKAVLAVDRPKPSAKPIASKAASVATKVVVAAAKDASVVKAASAPVVVHPKRVEIASEKPVSSTVASVVEAVSPPVAPTAIPAEKPAPAALPPEMKGVRVMATTIPSQPKAAAEKVKMMISDFNDRAKAAFEKSAKAGEELTEFTKGNMEALAASAKTAAKGAETLGQEMADYGKKSFESASATMKSLATVKTPTEMFQIQSDFAKSSFDSAIAEASKLSEAWLKLAGDVIQPLSSRYALAAEKFKSAAL